MYGALRRWLLKMSSVNILHNKLLDASGGSVFLVMTRPAMLD